MNNRKRHSGKASVETALVSMLVIIFFICTVLMYYNMLLAEKKDNIVKTGQTIAQETTNSVEEYLSVHTHFVSFSTFALEKMISEGATHEEIREFIETQSAGIINSPIGISTGLDCYIQGEFIRGDGVVPPEGFDATVRPWYTNAIAGNGAISILEPYEDYITGKYNLNVGRMLSDGESVISTDVSLDNIQETVENAVKYKDADVMMILNEDGLVIAHSDKGEMNKRYGQEKDGFGAAVFSHMDRYDYRSENYDPANDNFEFKYDGKNYVAYVKPVMDGWNCVTIMDATSTYRSIRMILLATIVLIVVIVLIITYIMNTSGKRGIAAEEALVQIAAKDVFLSEKAAELRATAKDVNRMKEEDKNKMKNRIRAIADEMQIVSGKAAVDPDKGGNGFLPL